MYYSGVWTQNQSSTVVTQAVCTDEDYDSIGPAVNVSFIGGQVAYYCWYVTHTQGIAYLFKQQGGTITILATTTYLAEPGDTNLLIYYNGTLYAYINGILILSANDATPLPAGNPGIAGFGFYYGPTDYPDNRTSSWSGSNITIGLDTSISRTANGLLAIGNGTSGDSSGGLNFTTLYLSPVSAAPTSVGTAGTAGEIVYYNGLLYFCSVTGTAGLATWNKLSMTVV